MTSAPLLPRPPPASSMSLLPGPARAGPSLHLLTNSQHHLCPLEFHPPFSEIRWGLDTPAVGSLMICCIPHAHNMDACGSGATVGRSPHHKDNSSAPPPVPAWLCCRCPVVVVGKRVSIVSRVSGFQGSRVNGSLGLNGFQGYQRSKGFRV
mgnify:CR=1 FL=1